MKRKSLIVLGALLASGLYGFTEFTKSKTDETGVSKFIETASYEVGDEAQDFNLLNIDGSKKSLASFKGAKGYIVVFTSNHCPFSKAYEERMVALDTKYASLGYPVIALNPNDPEAYEEDTHENMKKRAAEKGFTYPYLVDDKGIGQIYGAKRTPQVFVLKKEGGKNIVKYIGAIDDNAQDASSVNKKYVEDAVNNLLANKPVVTQNTKAIGCAIKWRSNI
ncbi:MAG: glutathione peroxidase-family protein [Arcticibacterium sp.]|jgi:glutathione peroxidase-family protein